MYYGYKNEYFFAITSGKNDPPTTLKRKPKSCVYLLLNAQHIFQKFFGFNVL
ncbi:MAG: hypothetical protein [Podoviridae sp. ctg2L5]|nr:MAG: hypothetical protein [Podoviridae sp. ctg2L5]